MYFKRYLGFLIIAVALAVVYIFRLVNMQIINSDYYIQAAEKRSTKTVSVISPRGEIQDRYGKAFVSNRMAFSVVLDRSSLPKNSQNTVLADLLTTLEFSGIEYLSDLPIEGDDTYQFIRNEESENPEKKIEKLRKLLKLSADSTADDAMTKLIKRYGLKDVPDSDKVRIAGIRYDMEQAGFSASNPFVVASNVDMATITTIRERYEFFPGVIIDTRPIREYISGQTAAHLLGTVGKIDKDETEKYLNSGYKLSDTVGKSGVERTFESYLRGISGTKIVDSESNIASYLSEPKPGSNVMLTIDSRLQEVAEASLEKTIKSIAAKGLQQSPGKDEKTGWDADAGAVVVMKVDTGEVLASASYPTFNPATFNKDYEELAAIKAKPLFNRVASGTYAPGSTFKMATALAGLMEGVVNTNTIIKDEGVYTFYKPYKYNCWIYSDTGGTHGNCDVEKALKVSCNYYFYETARLLGIDKLDFWCRRLGFGEKTGVEMDNEYSGVLSSPEYKAKFGEQWFPGDTLITAIGQSYNAITPIQLASYVATIVNGGTRYQPTILREVKSHPDNTTVKAFEPKIIDSLDIPSNVHKALMNGMRAVTEDGTASNVFGNYPIAVGGKTGTATVSKGTASGVFVAFAPFDNPEIVVAVVVEHGAHGNYVAPVARDIFDRYFADRDGGNAAITDENQIIIQ